MHSKPLINIDTWENNRWILQNKKNKSRHCLDSFRLMHGMERMVMRYFMYSQIPPILIPLLGYVRTRVPVPHVMYCSTRVCTLAASHQPTFGSLPSSTRVRDSREKTNQLTWSVWQSNKMGGNIAIRSRHWLDCGGVRCPKKVTTQSDPILAGRPWEKKALGKR